MVDNNLPPPPTPNYDKLTNEQKAAVDWHINPQQGNGAELSDWRKEN